MSLQQPVELAKDLQTSFIASKFNWATSEYPLILPHKSKAATSTSYSVLGSNPCSVVLVVGEYTVV